MSHFEDKVYNTVMYIYIYISQCICHNSINCPSKILMRIWSRSSPLWYPWSVHLSHVPDVSIIRIISWQQWKDNVEDLNYFLLMSRWLVILLHVFSRQTHRLKPVVCAFSWRDVSKKEICKNQNYKNYGFSFIYLFKQNNKTWVVYQLSH